eukprot:gene11493-8817_t
MATDHKCCGLSRLKNWDTNTRMYWELRAEREQVKLFNAEMRSAGGVTLDVYIQKTTCNFYAGTDWV